MQPYELTQDTALNDLRTEYEVLERQYLRFASPRPSFSPEFQNYILDKLLAAKAELKEKLEDHLSEARC